MSVSASSSSSPSITASSTSPPPPPPSHPSRRTDARHGASGTQLPRRSSHSHRDWQEARNSQRPFEQTMSEFLRDHPTSLPPLQMTAEARRQNIISMDRKRRLTSSTLDGSRRRATPGGLHDREVSQSSSSSDLPSTAALQGASTDPLPNLEREIIDLTASSPPPPLPPSHHRGPSRTSSSSSRRYIVPSWQADADASECPICNRPFTWMFRRHHCRKCGRVVCNDCSPHRITIPRQFIVFPPGPDQSSSSPLPPAPRQIETVDLTGDDDEQNALSNPRRNRFSSAQPLDGGEKVRLCNPCVPDPQPEPLPNFPPGPDEREGESLFQPRQNFTAVPHLRSSQAQANLLGLPNRSSGMFASVHPQDYRSTAPINSATLHGGRPQISAPFASLTSLSPPLPPPPRRYGPPALPDRRPLHPLGRNNNELPPLPSAIQGMPSIYSHSRYQSLDSHGRSHSGTSGRPRVHSMIDADPRYLGMEFPGSHARPHAVAPSRPRLHERDICPICRQALPPQGSNGDESLREAHIMSCISARDPTARPGQGSSSRGVLHMVSFVATEKDCLGEDGNAQECSICMVEYDVGEELSRLECFCKFHKECIVSWLNRKAECPVHKVGELRML